jgi:hypothetical protein
MEALIFALIATRNGYAQHETFVPEPAAFRSFDLHWLRDAYHAEDNSRRRASNRKKWVLARVVS